MWLKTVSSNVHPTMPIDGFVFCGFEIQLNAGFCLFNLQFFKPSLAKRVYLV